MKVFAQGVVLLGEPPIILALAFQILLDPGKAIPERQDFAALCRRWADRGLLLKRARVSPLEFGEEPSHVLLAHVPNFVPLTDQFVPFRDQSRAIRLEPFDLGPQGGDLKLALRGLVEHAHETSPEGLVRNHRFDSEFGGRLPRTFPSRRDSNRATVGKAAGPLGSAEGPSACPGRTSDESSARQVVRKL